MDFARFGLTRRPFRPTPDTDLYFAASAHEAAVASLRNAFEDRDGVALIDGEPGTGKTLAALRFLESLPPAVPRVLIPAPRFTRPGDFFQAILFDFGANYQGLSEQELRLAVTDHLLAGMATGQPTVIVLDEAQHLGSEILEEIRLLGNLESRSAKAAFVVLVAQPSLRERLGQPELAAFAQRIAVRSRIEPMSREESGLYLEHQIRMCGGDAAECLTAEAQHLLTGGCRGIPRLLNQVSAAAFALTAAGDERTVDVEAVVEALTHFGLAVPEEEIAEEPMVIPHPARGNGKAAKARGRRKAE